MLKLKTTKKKFVNRSKITSLQQVARKFSDHQLSRLNSKMT